MKIGVLGGIGPAATGQFYNRLIGRLQQGLVRKNEDFPQIIINSINAPELVGDFDSSQLAMYRQGLSELDMHRPDFIVMVCNTIHLFYDELSAGVGSEILDLRRAVDRLMKGNVVVFGTRQAVSQLYSSAQKPSEEEMRVLDSAIVAYNRGELGVAHDVENIAKKYSDKGYTVLLGCTEFAVMLGSLDIPKIDTVEVLVEEAMQRITG